MANDASPPVSGHDAAAITKGFKVFARISCRIWAPDQPAIVHKWAATAHLPTALRSWRGNAFGRQSSPTDRAVERREFAAGRVSSGVGTARIMSGSTRASAA